MDDEPQYVDDPFEEDTTYKKADTHFQSRILVVAFRGHFKNAAEKTRVEKIENHIGDYKPGSKSYPAEYVDGILKWASETNQKAKFAKIQLPVIIGMITDSDRLAKWLSRNNK